MIENGIIYSLATINQFSVLSWHIEDINNFKNILQNKSFPCVFGLKAVENQSLRLLFTENDFDIISGLIEYTRFIKDTPQKDRILCPLLITIKDESILSIEDAHKKAWNILQMLHNNDHSDWPTHIPVDVNNSSWTFCFNGVELFINISSLYHDKMKSRNLGNKLNFIVNPREIFDVVANGNELGGIKMREMIRNRVSNYNAGVVPLSLGSFGSESNCEWKQYQLTETGDPIKVCPLKIGNKND